jgi:tetratricopeptide (TPR) repeat protein
MRYQRFLLPILLSTLLVTGCNTLPEGQEDLYSLRREAQEAYSGNQNVRAEMLLLGLLRAVPNDAEAWFYLGNLYARTSRPDEAVKAYQKSLMLNRSEPRAWHNLGVVRLRESWAAFIQAHDLAPADHPLHDRIEAVIRAMETIPLDGLRRTKNKSHQESQDDLSSNVEADRR